MQFFTFQLLTSQYFPPYTSFPNIHMPGQTQIIDTFPDKWQDRSEQKTLSPTLPPSTVSEAQRRLNKLLTPDMLQMYLSCNISLKTLPRKMFQVYCETQISEICQDLSRFHQVCQLRRKTLDSTLDKHNSTLDKHCLRLIFVSRFPKSSWNNTQLNAAVWGENIFRP